MAASMKRAHVPIHGLIDQAVNRLKKEIWNKAKYKMSSDLSWDLWLRTSLEINRNTPMEGIYETTNASRHT